jgi:NTE family protein
VSVISAVSGGSVLAALYCGWPGSFDEFESKTRTHLRAGFVWPAVVVALTTTEGIKALLAFLPFAVDRVAALLAGIVLGILPLRAPAVRAWIRESPFRRWASRTTILARVFDNMFGQRKLPDLRSDRPRLLILACELRAKAAFYFAADRLHCWRYGSADSSNVRIGEAVVASAGYPAALPALDQRKYFSSANAAAYHRVILTDGGVYDNLGLAPFWPDRDLTVSLDPGSFDRIIACRAGYALEVADPVAFFPSRMVAVVESIHARAQNLATSRLFELQKAGRIEKVLLPYLGQDDGRLRAAPTNLIARETVANYPTDFSAMSDEWIDRLSGRGEQLVQALLAEHWQLESGPKAEVVPLLEG